MFVIGSPGPDTLADVLGRAEIDSLSYTEVGATAQETLPPGYRHDHKRVVLGSGNRIFDRAADALRHWHMHTRAGFEVFPKALTLAPDLTVLVIVRLGPMSAVAPCRVVYVVEEPNQFGFAYGTLPGHPEQGEEAFIVEQSESGKVDFGITAFSREHGRLARLGGPVTRTIQNRATWAYIRAIENIATGS